MNEESHDNTPERKKPGPSGEPKWAEKTIQGIVVGRNKTIVPPEEVVHLASLGCTDREIANYFDVHENTLRYNFKDYLVKGRHQLKTTLRQAQLRVALDGNPTMLIFLAKNYLGMSDSGQTTDEVRALPWTDDIDEVASADDDDFVENSTLVVEDKDE